MDILEVVIEYLECLRDEKFEGKCSCVLLVFMRKFILVVWKVGFREVIEKLGIILC